MDSPGIRPLQEQPRSSPSRARCHHQNAFSFSQNTKAGRKYRSCSVTFLIVSKPGSPSRVRAYSLLLLPTRWLPETGRANFTARRRLWGWHTPASGTFIPWHLDGSASFPEGKASEPRARPSSGMGGWACWLPSDEGGSLSGCGSASFLP